MKRDATKESIPAKTQTTGIKGIIKRSPWLFGAGVAVVICLLLGFTPGGQAMPVLAFWIAGWTFTIWLLRRYKAVQRLTIALLIISIVLFFIAYMIARGSSAFGV